MRTVSYPSDLTGFQWSLIKPHLPVYPGGRPRKTDLRDVVDAIFYILRTGCQWRYLPKDFPPKSTVWRYFNQWRHNGTLETIHDLLRRKVRAAEKPYSPRTSASVDSQSVDTTSGGEQRGRDNAKNVDGRKRHIVVDSMGLLMAVLVTAASIDDAKAAAELFARLDGQPMSHVKRMYADSKYHNFILYEWVETNAAWELNIVQRPKDAVGWVLLPIRWTVERTFAWLGRCRRLSKDREKSVRSSEAFVKLAMIHLMLNRLAQKKRMPSSTIVRRHKPTCGTDTHPDTSTASVIVSLLPDARNQPVSDSLCVLLVPHQFVPQGSVLPNRSQDQKQARQDGWDQSPQGTQSQGHAHEEEAGGDVTGMPHNGIRTGVDDRVTTVRLDADGRLEELAHRLRPGHARQSGDQQDIPDPADPAGYVGPVKTTVVQGCHREDRDNCRD